MSERETVKVPARSMRAPTPSELMSVKFEDNPIEPPNIPTDETRSEKKARLARILDRGIINDRITIDLPSDLYGEWVRNDQLEIQRMQVLGFQVDHEYAPKSAIHNDGSGAAILGDVIFMTCDRETKEIIDEIRAEQYYAMNRKGREEDEYQTSADSLRPAHIIPTVESQERAARKQDILDAVRATDEQIQPAG